jgi:YHS domain-containing protein
MGKRMWKSVPAVLGCVAALAFAIGALAGCRNGNTGTVASPPAASPSGGCCGGGSASCAPAKPAASINTICPVSGDKISGQPQFMRQFKGRNVAFCSQFCTEQWDRLSDQEKQEKLDKVLSPSTVTPARTSAGG